MGRSIIKIPDGGERPYVVFSTVVDNIVTPPMSREELGQYYWEQRPRHPNPYSLYYEMFSFLEDWRRSMARLEENGTTSYGRVLPERFLNHDTGEWEGIEVIAEYCRNYEPEPDDEPDLWGNIWIE